MGRSTSSSPCGPRGTGAAVAVAALLACGAALAAPFLPKSDAQVLEQVPARAVSAAERELRELRAALARDPANAATAEALVERYLERLFAEGDPRDAGHAQAALAPWWKAQQLPTALRVQRAVLLQFDHRFDDALADLRIAAQEEPERPSVWAWLAAIAMVQARYADARQACDKLLPLTSELSGQACIAAAEGASGDGAAAVQRLQQALADEDDGEPDERLWALTRLAEIHERLGDAAAAERAFRAALALQRDDQYLYAAYADFLLDQRRAAEVLELLKDKTRSDVLLLRLALAGKATGASAAAGWRSQLATRFDAARRRGDTTHQKEEARFALAVLGDAARALPLARSNFQLQREPADARLLLEAALAARDRAAAAPALAWYRASKIQSRVLAALVQQVEALP